MAQFNLASIYDNAQGVPQDYTEAAQWYQKAAEQGIWEAQFNLAGLYFYGEGVKQDYVQSYAWYAAAEAIIGYSEAKVKQKKLKVCSTRKTLSEQGCWLLST